MTLNFSNYLCFTATPANVSSDRLLLVLLILRGYVSAAAMVLEEDNNSIMPFGTGSDSETGGEQERIP